MQTLITKYPDKPDYPGGPWDSEPDKKQWMDEETGLPCLIVRNPFMGNLCGYVGVPEGHPDFRKPHKEVLVKVHGCLSYSSLCSGLICHTDEPGEHARASG